MPHLEELYRQTRTFYDWEVRGRGWLDHAEPVALEPPFRPFRRPVPEPVREDDGRRPGLRDRFLHLFTPRPPVPPVSGEDDANDLVTPYAPAGYEESILLFPEDASAEHAVREAWLRAASLSSHPVVFEILGSQGSASLHLATSQQDGLVGDQLRAHVPDLLIKQSEEPIRLHFTEAPSVAVLEFGLSREFMLPLRQPEERTDPLSALVGAMTGLAEGEAVLLQVLFEETRHPWAAEASIATISPDGDPFLLDAPDFSRLAAGKLAEPVYAVVLRAVAAGNEPESLFERLVAVASALKLFADPAGNELVPLATEDQALLVEDILARRSRRSGMLLSLSELASLIALPGKHFTSPFLVRATGADLPADVLGAGTKIGRTVDGRSVHLSLSARLQHTHIIGASGTGKSTLLERMIVEDLAQGMGLALLDPHGDLVDAVIGRIPEARVQDVALFDPGSGQSTIGWNVLSATSDASCRVLSSDLIALIRRQSTSWGDQMQSLLGNAIDTILAGPQGGTLLDLRRLLVDESFRQEYIKHISDEYLLNFWRHEFSLLIGRKPQVPIITRLDTFLRSSTVRDAVCRRDDPLDFRSFMDNGGILLAKLSQGLIGEENCALLGSLILSAFHQAALSRQDTRDSERRAFHLYADEFHTIAAPSLSAIFSGVRKYGLGLTVAHQSLHQLHAEAPEVERAVLSNAYTRIVFRVAEEDAEKLHLSLRPHTAEDLLGLQRGEAVVRVGPPGKAFKLLTDPLEPVSADRAEANRQRIEAETPSRTSTASPVPSVPKQPAPRVISRPSRKGREKAPTTPGRGGAVHKYLQHLIRDWGKRSGYRVEIEKVISGGRRVDVALYAEDHSIACEIAGITTVEQECANIAKCLSEGFNQVVAVSLDAGFLEKLDQALTERLSVDEKTQVELATPEELSEILRHHEAPASVQRVAGYMVRVRQGDAGTGIERGRRTAAQVLLGSIRRLREKE